MRTHGRSSLNLVLKHLQSGKYGDSHSTHRFIPLSRMEDLSKSFFSITSDLEFYPRALPQAHSQSESVFLSISYWKLNYHNLSSVLPCVHLCFILIFYFLYSNILFNRRKTFEIDIHCGSKVFFLSPPRFVYKAPSWHLLLSVLLSRGTTNLVNLHNINNLPKHFRFLLLRLLSLLQPT